MALTAVSARRGGYAARRKLWGDYSSFYVLVQLYRAEFGHTYTRVMRGFLWAASGRQAKESEAKLMMKKHLEDMATRPKSRST